MTRSSPETETLQRIANMQITPDTGASVAMEMRRQAQAALACADTSTDRPSKDPLAGLVERLDRLLLTSTEDNRSFVLATESARNIVEIVREWVRSDASARYSVTSPVENSK